MNTERLIAGRYRLRERLGQGGMAVVWRAEDDVLGREVAIKVLSADLADDPELRRQIRSEARSVARLRHTNVVGVFDYGEFDDDGRTLSFVVMELVDGRTLADMLTGGRLPWKVAVLVGAQVAAALAAAHAEGIVHRDVKPANVMVGSAGVKLVDFGISAAVGALDGQGGLLQGTPAYLAPERIKGGPVRPATDVYALGLMLYLALAGQMPWPAATLTETLRAHVYAKPAPLPGIPGLPSAVARIVLRCLAKQAADRPSSIELAEALGEVVGLPSAALMRSAAGPTVAQPAVTTRRRTGSLLVAASVATAMLTLGGAWWVNDRPAQPAEAAEPAATCTTDCASSTPPSSTVRTGTVRPRASTVKVAVTVERNAPAPKQAGPKKAAPKKAGPKKPPKAKAKPPKK
ncbi:MAG: serine/threonine-protein kinase [Actinoplanes sp.]